MERLGPLDAFFLEAEDAANHMHIGALGIMEGPPPASGALERLVAGKLPLVPRYRHKVRLAPGNVGRPVWIDDTHFDLTYHLRHTALPPPGGDDELRNLMGRVMSQQLSRQRPLWEMWVIEGLPDDRWAVLTKVHHAIVDGIAGTDLMAAVFDIEPEPPPPPEDNWSPAPEPSTLDLALHSLGGLLAAPVERARSVVPMLGRPTVLVRQLVSAARGLGRMGGLLRPSESSMMRPIGPHRRWCTASATLADVKTIRGELGGTVNDVVLALVTRGWRELLQERGEVLDGRVVRTVVPVSMRSPDERGQLDNRVSVMFADLPVGIDDPIERLSSISAQLDTLKGSGEIEAVDSAMVASDYAPALPHALAARTLTHLQPFVETITTNVPGPQFPLYAAGRRMVEAFPYVPIVGRMDLTVAIFSYIGQLTFGVTGEYDHAPDIDVLCAGIEKGVQELLDAAKEADAG
ncbi:MAG: wax ester/triacylglycerol synthase family O-acyltransferase [Acidimicrobiia bacterium]|nr:wax ester/triacylglycerol synthase family O-acyltransferase [Acidimicrobiia bacterium]